MQVLNCIEEKEVCGSKILCLPEVEMINTEIFFYYNTEHMIFNPVVVSYMYQFKLLLPWRCR